MTDITIPPKAVEAATDAVHDFFHNTHSRMFSRELAHAALRAGIAAWPGVFYHPARPDEEACIFLPLPQGDRDE